MPTIGSGALVLDREGSCRTTEIQFRSPNGAARGDNVVTEDRGEVSNLDFEQSTERNAVLAQLGRSGAGSV